MYMYIKYNDFNFKKLYVCSDFDDIGLEFQIEYE